MSIAANLVVCDVGSSLHTSHYCKAFSHLPNVVYVRIPPKLSRYQILFYAATQAEAYNCKNIIFLSFEKLVGIHLVYYRVSPYICKFNFYGFYFSLHNLAFAGVKQFLFSLLLALSPFKKIFVSDQSFNSYPYNWLVKNKIAYAPDFWDPNIAETPSKTICMRHVSNFFSFDPIHHKYIVTLSGGIDERKSANLLIELISQNKDIFSSEKILFIIAGRFSEGFLRKHQETLVALQKNNIIRYHNGYLSLKLLNQLIKASDYCWCVREGFYGSSGTMTLSLALGIVPIVSRDSLLYRTCTSIGLGIVMHENFFAPVSVSNIFHQSKTSIHSPLSALSLCFSLRHHSLCFPGMTLLLEHNKAVSCAEFLSCISHELGCNQ